MSKPKSRYRDAPVPWLAEMMDRQVKPMLIFGAFALLVVLFIFFALLLCPLVAHAAPVHFDPPATFHALACKWGTTFNADGVVAPPCGGPFEVRQFLPPGDPTSLWGTLAYYPTGFESHAAVSVSQDRRITTGGLERFPITLATEGDYYFAVALSSPEYNALALYFFTLDLPTSGSGGLPSNGPAPPLEATPEPTTLLLLGTSLGVAGWVARKRGRR